MTFNLKDYAKNKYSQFGEDGIIQKVFEILPSKEEYWCVEFGAWDGKYLSNTYELIANNGWKGILIEGNSKKIPDLKNSYSNNRNVTLINKLVSYEGVDILDNILDTTSIPNNFDLLSIDIDGNDYHVWESLQNYKPNLVIVEFNPSIPSDVEFIQEKNLNVNHGNSLLSLVNLGKKKGYELIATTTVNGFFIRKELFHLFNIKNNNISVLWDSETPAPRVFQLYDGTLALTSKFELIWQRKSVDIFDLQILSKDQRSFSDKP
ncbi:MAG: hypothetical protein HKP28_07095 [Winogradskyella sp.]|nr:hypothetical protein [Winogradskyella sp.]